jgi:septin family protein
MAENESEDDLTRSVALGFVMAEKIQAMEDRLDSMEQSHFSEVSQLRQDLESAQSRIEEAQSPRCSSGSKQN